MIIIILKCILSLLFLFFIFNALNSIHKSVGVLVPSATYCATYCPDSRVTVFVVGPNIVFLFSVSILLQFC